MRRLNRDRLSAILVVLPSILLIAVFVYGFIGATAWTSMTNWHDLSANPNIQFVGLKNYQELFSGILRSPFRQSLTNTVFFTVEFLMVCLAVGLLLAILVDQRIRGEGVFRTIFLFPMSLSFVVTGVIWRWLFRPSTGINLLISPFYQITNTQPFNWYLEKNQILVFHWQDVPKAIALLVPVGLFVLAAFIRGAHRQRYRAFLVVIGTGMLAWYLLGGTTTLTAVPPSEIHGFYSMALTSLVIAASWQVGGYVMAMFLAGLRGIPEELREAARVDGCNEAQLYWYIILPLLKPITLSAAIILGQISLKIFDLAYIMGGENPPTNVPGIDMYLISFRGNNFALGAAIAMIMLIGVSLIIIPYLVTIFRAEAT
jgi:glucose/mannose transport system permease protein